jgi:hypothetical protein
MARGRENDDGGAQIDGPTMAGSRTARMALTFVPARAGPKAETPISFPPLPSLIFVVSLSLQLQSLRRPFVYRAARSLRGGHDLSSLFVEAARYAKLGRDQVRADIHAWPEGSESRSPLSPSQSGRNNTCWISTHSTTTMPVPVVGNRESC